MDDVRTITVTLPAEVVDRVEERVASGEYLSASDVVRDGLKQLEGDKDWAPSDEWLRREVLPVLDECERDPSRLLSSDEVRRELHDLHATEVEARSRVV